LIQPTPEEAKPVRGDPFNVIFPLLLMGGFATAVASRGFRVDDQRVRDWAASAGVDLDDTTQPIVRRSLLWSRRARTLGGLAGFLGPVLYEALRGRTAENTGGWSISLMLVGYLLGALLAEVIVNRPSEGDGAALLVPRRLEDYLPSYVRIMQRSLGLLSLLGAATYAIVYAATDGGAFATSAPSPLEVAAYGIGGACIAAITEAVQRSLVHRRQAFSDPARVAVDDAMRSSSLHLLSGAGIALLCIVAGSEIGLNVAMTGQVGGIVSLGILLLTFAAAFSFWRDLSRPHGFRVHRNPGRRVRA
jgi:hypothetical protein